MMFEHDQERQSIEDLERNVRLSKLPDFAAAASRLTAALRNHIYKEDNLLFPEADSLLTHQQDEALFGKLQSYDTALDRQILDQKLSELRSLEWRYLRK